MLKKWIVIAALGTGAVYGEGAYVPILDMETNSLLGAVQGTSLYKSMDSYEKLKSSAMTQTYRLYTAHSSSQKEFTLKSMQVSEDEPCSDNIDIESTVKVSYGVALPTGIGWSPQPRPITVQSNENPTYQKILRDLLTQKGVANPVAQIKEMYRTDLDGDGSDEAVIVAEHYAKPVPRNGARFDTDVGDYSFILVRRIVGGKVENIVFEESVHTASREDGGQVPYDLKIVSIADINGDGTMELIVNSSYYEGSFTVAYTIDGSQAKDLLMCGCGL